MDFVIFANCIIQEFIIIFNSKTEKFTTYPVVSIKNKKAPAETSTFHTGVVGFEPANAAVKVLCLTT